jgi:hypothetical protein
MLWRQWRVILLTLKKLCISAVGMLRRFSSWRSAPTCFGF